jgi:UDP-N-acetylmuramoyl-tripeptide--D-alanyl-D-alanine ligase
MKIIHLSEVAAATKGRVLKEAENDFMGIGSDTRANLTGQLFFALKGDAFDAHDFLDRAIQAGATGLVIHDAKKAKEISGPITIILVKDTLQALQDLALHSRRASSAKIIGITGSNGKTTSKEFSNLILQQKLYVHMPKGSFNNHWGVPFTLLAEPEETDVSLIEMGMNHAGEIKRLCEIAEPDVVVCSMVGRAHIENFGSEEKIAAAKEEIYEFAKPAATRIYNLDNPWTNQMFGRHKKHYPNSPLLCFSGKDSSANVFLKIKNLTMSSISITGKIGGVTGEAEVQVFGAQNLVNLMVASSVALAVGMKPEEIWQALPACKTNWGRNQLVHLKSGAELLFDGYNANPDSMAALLENMRLIQNSGKKIGIFAQMKELGELSPQLHKELGRKVGDSGFDIVWFYGSDAPAFERGIGETKFSKKLYISDTYEHSLASQVASVLQLHDTVVVKGSRSMEMEKFVFACDPVDFEKK